jgi:hypothetical protein
VEELDSKIEVILRRRKNRERELRDERTAHYSKGCGGKSLSKDVLHEMGCLAVSRVSCELKLHGRLREVELNRGITHGHDLSQTVVEVKRIIVHT